MKKIYMPLVYGQTKHSATTDIISNLGENLDGKDAYKLAEGLYKFWESRFPQVFNLMTLVNEVGWFAAFFNRAIVYEDLFIKTVQDFMVSKPLNVWVYDRKKKKRHKKTLILPTNERNKMKSKKATFANLIHQKDATIASLIIQNCDSLNIPVYTVHDNFLTTATHYQIPALYARAFVEGLPGPLFIVNKMLYSNIIQYSPLEEVTNQQPLVKVKSNDFFTGDEVILIFLSLEPEEFNVARRKMWKTHFKAVISC